ncbi:MAG: cytochrome c oxidase subunit 4 [Actinobacteria bacterium]|nr:cytochrome c oxidase subunit 4 [Actinomycetota bacterium]
MKTSVNLFSGLAVFYFLVGGIYWLIGGEAVGITALILSGGLAALVGFYMWYARKRIGGLLPEDRPSAEIADGAGEIGFYSPHSWWPLPVALAASVASLGLIIGWWLTFIGIGALLVSVLGYVTEYERPTESPHH